MVNVGLLTAMWCRGLLAAFAPATAAALAAMGLLRAGALTLLQHPAACKGADAIIGPLTNIFWPREQHVGANSFGGNHPAEDFVFSKHRVTI